MLSPPILKRPPGMRTISERLVMELFNESLLDPFTEEYRVGIFVQHERLESIASFPPVGTCFLDCGILHCQNNNKIIPEKIDFFMLKETKNSKRCSIFIYDYVGQERDSPEQENPFH